METPFSLQSRCTNNFFFGGNLLYVLCLSDIVGSTLQAYLALKVQLNLVCAKY